MYKQDSESGNVAHTTNSFEMGLLKANEVERPSGDDHDWHTVASSGDKAKDMP